MPIQRKVIVGAIGVGAATCGCYFIYKQITRHYSLVEPGGTENDASGSEDFCESAEIKEQEGNTSEQRTFHRSEGHLSDQHPVNSGSDTEQGTSYGTSGEDNCINCNASQSNEPEDDGYVISRQTVLKKANDLGDNHVNSHHESLHDNYLTNTSNLRQLLDNSKLDSCSADPTPQKYASLNFEKSMMPCNDKDLEKEKEFDGQKPDVTNIQSVQMEGNANQNQKWPALQLNQSDLTVDSETHGPPERSFPEILTMYDDLPTTTSTPADGRRFTYQGSKDSTSSLSSQHSLEMDVEPLGPSGRMSVSEHGEFRHVLNETIPDSIIEEPFLPANSFRYSEFPGLSIREEETSLSTSSYTSQTQNTHYVSPAHHIIQSQAVQAENVASHTSQPENQQSSQLLQPCISSQNVPEPSPQLPTISPETSLPPAGSTTRDLSIQNTNQNITVSSVQNQQSSQVLEPCISSTNVPEPSPQLPTISPETSLPPAGSTIRDLSIQNTNQNITVSSVQNPILRTNDNNLDTGQGQSDNDRTVTESVVDNESNESTSEYGTMTSNSDNLSPSLDDQSNTDNVTPEVQEAVYCRSNPECKTSLPNANTEPCTGTDKSVTEQVETISDLDDEKDITDVVILHAEDDRPIALDFIHNMEVEFPGLELNLKIFEQLNLGKSMFASASLLFETCRFLFVFVTKKFAKDELPRFLNEIALIESITFKDKNCRLIPVLIDEDCYLPELAPLIPLKYNRYLEGKSRGIKDRGFLNGFEKLMQSGRKNYLTS